MKKTLYKKITIVLFALFLAIMPILTIVFLSPESRPFSENENKYLAAFPKLSFDSYKDKEFMDGFDTWISDRFFGRENWIKLKNQSDKLLGKKEINGVFVYNDMMMQVWNSYDESLFEKNISAINTFAENHSEIPMYFMLVPNAQEIHSDLLPPYASGTVGDQKEFIDKVYSSLSGFAGTIDAYTILKENKNDYIYYRTDHHWTSLGAFFGYSAAGEQLGYSPYELSDFTVEHVSDEFKGTLFSKTLDDSVTPDVMDYYTLTDAEPDVKLSVFKSYNAASGEITYDEHNGLYFREYLGVKDKYSSFLGQNASIVTIETENAKSDRSLLVIKDSYAHSMIPFLSKEYSKITMIDLRYINTDFSEFISLDDYDQVLFLYNVITFSEDENIIKLNYCK